MNTTNHILHGDGTYIDLAGEIGIGPQLILAVPFVLVLILYLIAVIISNRKFKKWPRHRTVFWIFGVICAIAALIGPFAARAHMDFTVHMLGHLLLGMLAPLLMVLAAPITLIMRALNVRTARRLSRLLRSSLAGLLTHPMITSLLNIGGLWLLYTTPLYSAMHQSNLIHVFVHAHVFLAGYLFTASIIYIDPTPHRFSFVYRAILFVISLAGHGMLSKYIFAYPPSGVPVNQAETGAMLMYYGGDYIDLIIIFILCYQWYKAARPEKTSLPETY